MCRIRIGERGNNGVLHIEETKKKEATREKREQPRGIHLEKEDSQERELCMEKKNRMERAKYYHL